MRTFVDVSIAKKDYKSLRVFGGRSISRKSIGGKEKRKYGQRNHFGDWQFFQIGFNRYLSKNTKVANGMFKTKDGKSKSQKSEGNTNELALLLFTLEFLVFFFLFFFKKKIDRINISICTLQSIYMV